MENPGRKALLSSILSCSEVMRETIDQGPFELRTTRNTLRTTPEGGILLGPERPRTYEDLSDTEKKRYDADVRLSSQRTTRESQLYDEFERFKMLPGENINEYYVRFHKLVNDMRNIRMTMPNIQLNSKFVNNMSPEWDRFVTAVKLNKGNGGAQNRAGNANAGQGKPVKCYNCNGIGHIARNCTQMKHPQNSDYFKDKMLLMQAQENGAVLDEEELLFLAGEQSIFMANLSSAGSANQQDGLSNASILSEVHILENDIDHSVTNLGEHEIHNEVQQANVIDSTSVDIGNSNVIPYEQYLSIDNISVVPSCASFALNDECVSSDNYAFVPHDLIATELRIYKEQVAIYEQRAKFELTERQKGQPTLYDGEELLMTHHVPVNVPSSEEELELAETTRNKLHAKMNDSACVEKDLEKRKAEELKANALPLPVLPHATVYPPNTLVHLVPQTLPTTSQVNIGLYVITQLFWDFEKTCKKRITPTSITEGERGFEQTKRCYLTEVIPFFNLLKEHFDGVQKSLVTEVRAMKAVFENLEAEVDQNEINLKSGEIEWKNLLITNENLIAECLSKDVFYTATDYVLNVSRFSDLLDAFTSAQKRISDLESENFNLRNKIQHDDRDSMIKHFFKLEVEHFNLQLKCQNVKEHFGNKKPVTSSDAPSFDSLFVIGKLNEQIQNPTFDLKALVSQNKDLTAKLNALHDLNECFRAKNAKVKQHYKELYDSIKITRAKTTDQNNSLLSEIEHLKDQLKENSKCATIPDCKPKVLALGRYPIDVEPIPPRLKKNREVHLHYIERLKENVETLREIVEDAKVERPLDTSLASACRYTKHSQELLEYVIGTCPKDFDPHNKQNASTNSLRKKGVTFVEPHETSTHNTPPQVEHQKINSTNVPGIPSTGVKGASAASRSKPRSNTKKDRTLPAKSALKQVEAHSRMNKSNEKHKNRVDSSISYKRTVINSNSNTSCKTCNKCLISVNHDQCVVRSEMCVKQSSATKVWRVKQVKQVWKATGKLFTTIGHQWRPTGRLLPLGDQWPLTRNTPPKVLPTKQWKPTGRLLPLGRQCPLVRSTALKSDCLPADPQETIAPVVQIVLWYLDSGCSKHMTGDRSRLRNFVKKFIGTVRFGNDHFGAIMGYGDYVIGDSVISRVYYVEGLGHNLFSVGQFCDSDLEVAFRKHTCFVRDLDGVDLIKGSRGTNLYTISVEDMMRSSPICLLSKASKNKSWLWHRRLNHLNFGTLNDLARKDLVRGLPRLKFEKDHLCSACQLGKSRKATHKPKTINTITEVLHTLHMDLCGPLRVQSINGKKYILVIVDDYSRFTWVKFLRSKDETPAFVINLLKQLQVGLNKTVRFVRTDNGTEFVNKDLTDFYESVGITHEKTVPRTPQQNGVVERRNRTLVEAARTMLIFSKAPLFLWAEAVATACYTQNRSLIHTLHNKTPYELVHDKKPDLSFLRIFGALCYPTNDSEDLGKLKAKADIGFFVGYAPNRKGYRIYNKRTRQIMETIHVTFDELTEQTAPVHSSSGPNPNLLTPGPISSRLVPNSAPAIPYVPPTNKDLELLFQPMFDEYFETPTGDHQMTHVPAVPPPGSHSPSSSAHQSSSVHHGVATGHSFEVNPFVVTEHEPFVNVFALIRTSEGIILLDISRLLNPPSNQPHHPGRTSLSKDVHDMKMHTTTPKRQLSYEESSLGLGRNTTWRAGQSKKHNIARPISSTEAVYIADCLALCWLAQSFGFGLNYRIIGLHTITIPLYCGQQECHSSMLATKS
ncbi:retrovirus-related pol polyprotein from transposon TNT 1-94 [Tanacetum coccineum]